MEKQLSDKLGEQPWLDDDELIVVRSFLDFGVRFLVIGGRAVQFHGYRRPAKDLDLLVEFSPENWLNLAQALRPLNAGVKAFEEISAKPKWQARLKFYPTVEFVTAINGVSFVEAWTQGTNITFQGLTIRVLSKAHLIVSKQGSTRPVDLDDIRAIQAIS